MILGTRKIWFIAAGLLFIGGLVLTGVDIGGSLGNVAGIVCVFAGVIIFAGAPMRYGRPKVNPAPSPEERAQPAESPAPAPRPPRPRANIEAKDASEV